MIPIHELLNRIRWDQEFGQGHFELGYFDRYEHTIHRIALAQVQFPEGDHQALHIVDEAGIARRIPFHRIREVTKDGQVIWQRPPPAAGTG